MSIEVLDLIPDSPVNMAMQEIIQYWRQVKEPKGLQTVNGRVALGLSVPGDTKPRKEDIPAVYVLYKTLDGTRKSTTFHIAERVVDAMIYFQIYDFKEDGLDYGIQNKLENYSRYNLNMLAKPENGGNFTPTAGLFRFDTNLLSVPIRMVDVLEGITNQPVRPPYYMARADLRLIVNNHYVVTA